MLIFGKSQHVQNCGDAPSVHQAYDGYILNAMWSRLNPDDAYIAEIIGSPTSDYREIPANFIANSWQKGSDFGYDSYQAPTVVQAGVLEMMDRTHKINWKDDLDNALYK